MNRIKSSEPIFDKSFFIDFNNGQWEAGLTSAAKGNIVEMSEDAYEHFLGCVPPLEMCSSSFICSEPHHHNSQGKGVYIACISKNGKYYAQYGTLSQYKTRQLFKEI